MLHLKMYMSRATKKYKWVGEVKPKAKKLFKNVMNNFQSCLDFSEYPIHNINPWNLYLIIEGKEKVFNSHNYSSRFESVITIFAWRIT